MIGGKRRFLETNSPDRQDLFAAEAQGLLALRNASLRAPQPLAHGVAGGEAYLLLEYLELQRSGDFAALGRMLAKAHRQPAPQFGWARDNYIGSAPQNNTWCDDWAQFWRERRMRPQLEIAGLDVDVSALDQWLESHQPQPSLLHGDLWSGNVGFTQSGPGVFDPAVYYCDREADLAMTDYWADSRASSTRLTAKLFRWPKATISENTSTTSITCSIT